MSAKTIQNDQACWPISEPGSSFDRRFRPRLKLALPVALFRSGEAARTETLTENISCDSFYCVSEHRFSPDERLECELFIAGDELSSVPTDDLCVRCRVRVVRVVAEGTKARFGVACVLEDYTVSRSAISVSELAFGQSRS